MFRIIIYCIIGLILASIGFDFTTWQFWVILFLINILEPVVNLITNTLFPESEIDKEEK